jgi:gas vesicle protein
LDLSPLEKNKGKKGKFNMAEHEKPQCDFFMGLLIGGALGALAGILFAPKSGKELRSDIKEKGSEVLKDGKEIYADASTKAKEIIGEVKHQAKELKKEAEGTAEKIAGEVQEKIGQVKKVFGKS